MRSLRAWAVLACLLIVAACGGGGGDAPSPTPTTPTTPAPPAAALANFTAVTIDDGPPELGVGPGAYRQVNIPYVSITLCAPGTATCQTIDHIEVDTGSVGLRVVAGALDPALLAALPHQTLGNGDEVGECYGYVDGYVFGSVRAADFAIGGEKVAGMPFHVVGDGGRYAAVPASCSSGGGSSFTDIKGFGAKGILGIGVAPTDCGQACTAAGGASAAIYYDCPATGCDATTTRASRAAAPFEQVPNPVAAFATDNNGSILELSAPAVGGTATATGTLTFGIGTQTNNRLGSATVLPTTASTNPNGYGLLTATYRGQALPLSFVDSGSNLFLFTDATVPQCTGDAAGFFCPAARTTLEPVLRGTDGTTRSAAFALDNAERLIANGGAALPGLGGDPGQFDNLDPYPDSFDFGLPFFYGRRVSTAIEGRSADGRAGPFIAY